MDYEMLFKITFKFIILLTTIMILSTTPFFRIRYIVETSSVYSEKGESRLIYYSYRVWNFRNARNWTVAILNTNLILPFVSLWLQGILQRLGSRILACFHNINYWTIKWLNDEYIKENFLKHMLNLKAYIANCIIMGTWVYLIVWIPKHLFK